MLRSTADQGFHADDRVVLGVALVALGVLIGWQTRAIVRSPAPRLRAVEALATSVPMFLLVFAAGYCLPGNGSPPGFSEPLTHVDALYFTMTVFSSVGFGDIVPRTQAARALTTVQMVGDLVILGLVAKILLWRPCGAASNAAGERWR